MTEQLSALGSRPLSACEHEMLSFVIRWEPYGDGDEYILPEFGIEPVLFYRRILALLRSRHEHRIAADLQERLSDLCVRKIDGYLAANPATLLLRHG